VVALSAPFSDRISHHSIAGGDAAALLKLIGQARSRAEAALGQPVRVVCCYEAGYDGFWLHRVLSANGIDNHVLDAASLLVNRRARRAACCMDTGNAVGERSVSILRISLLCRTNTMLIAGTIFRGRSGG
jgi:hypothetical protein